MRLLRKETLRLEIEFGAMLRGARGGPGGETEADRGERPRRAGPRERDRGGRGGGTEAEGVKGLRRAGEKD